MPTDGYEGIEVPPRTEDRTIADRLAAHLIRAHELAVASGDPVATDLIRLALWHVGRTYAPTAERLVEDREPS
ncbi:hypothetical protein DA075_25825 [Methylobacterium currus]|uniref:Uncharacterized protein n=1 Tax=Methylobacterium currus TaxID=2051553 RepID=A0A2R4WQT4_9HYPH|nr:hypothetical protein [Methylobacterium currus]AWB23891.1 hypothetical protein DA075_25825 [Methylobacterium currus]UHC16452.1 hypothetical protein LRS73_00455 [Methylobacterium currus]